MFGCYDGYILLIGEQVIIFETKTPSLITDHELDMLVDALDDKTYTCDGGVQSSFVINMKLQVVKLGTVRIYFLKKKRILNTVHIVVAWLIFRI